MFRTDNMLNLYIFPESNYIEQWKTWLITKSMVKGLRQTLPDQGWYGDDTNDAAIISKVV